MMGEAASMGIAGINAFVSAFASFQFLWLVHAGIACLLVRLGPKRLRLAPTQMLALLRALVVAPRPIRRLGTCIARL